MPEILIVFASTHGHTGRIAARIADDLEAAGAQVDLRPVADASDCDPLDYDGVVVGGSIHMGHHQRDLVEWTRQHAVRLGRRPSAFYSVCLAVADGTEEGRQHAEDWIAAFEEDTGWTPDRKASFAGALQYREYGVVTRFWIRMMMARGGHPTDTRTDVDYTDWDDVDAFAADVADLVVAAEAIP